MGRFIKIDKDIYSSDLIESINLAATLPTGTGVEVRLRGEEQSFNYTGEFAEEAYDVLSSLVNDGFIKIATDMYPEARIVWINLNANINGATGVEVALDGEFLPPDPSTPNGVAIRSTRQYTADAANEAYTVLTGLVADRATLGAY